MTKKAKSVTKAWALKNDARAAFVYRARHPDVYLNRKYAESRKGPNQSVVRVLVTVEEVASD